MSFAAPLVMIILTCRRHGSLTSTGTPSPDVWARMYIVQPWQIQLLQIPIVITICYHDYNRNLVLVVQPSGIGVVSEAFAITD